MYTPRLALACLLVCGLVAPAAADTFVLKSGGKVEGTLVTEGPEASDKDKFVVKTEVGVVTLAKNQVKEVVRLRPAQVEYEKIRADFPDTAAGQWDLAEWCRKNNLTAARKVHLLRVIQLEPDHEGARGALGYSRYDGEWHTQDEVMTARGYVEYKGRWRLPQEVEILEEQRKVELAEKGWIEKIKRYRNWLDGDRHEEAAKFFREIDDPLAVPGLRRLLETDSIPEVRALVAAPLAQTGAAEAIVALAQRALDDDNEEVRQSCLDQLADGKHPEVVNLFIAKLRDKNNKTINRAAACLRRMNDPIAIVPLVDALVTTHKSIVTSGNPNGYTTSFGSGGSGFSAGSSSKVVSQTIQNPSVLDALVTLAKNVNFNYDVASWKSWLATQRKSKSFDARRG